MTDDDALIARLNAAYKKHADSCAHEGDDNNECECAEGCYIAAARIATLREQIERVFTVVNEQAEDAGLWFVAQFASEANLQEALRRLHAAVEGEKWTAERDYRIATLTAENESLRAECGLRQIRGYNEGKAKAEAALRQAVPREPTEAMCEALPAGLQPHCALIWRAMYDAAPAAAPRDKP